MSEPVDEPPPPLPEGVVEPELEEELLPAFMALSWVSSKITSFRRVMALTYFCLTVPSGVRAWIQRDSLNELSG